MIFEINSHHKIELNDLIAIAKQAGEEILKVYNDSPENMALTFKDDASPLTLADAVSNQVITAKLAALTPAIPLLSEEGRDIPYQERKQWEYYWCIDPLDGTKEFIKRNGEFTVNIALIHRDTPVLGIIYVPVTGVIYYGGLKIGSWKISSDGFIKELIVPVKKDNWVAVASRTHSSTEEADILAKFHVTKTISAGSSLKFCMIAEGAAQIYYRHGPTMEWDTAAGHAIVIYSGAFMTTVNGQPFYYNKPSLLNSGFICKIG